MKYLSGLVLLPLFLNAAPPTPVPTEKVDKPAKSIFIKCHRIHQDELPFLIKHSGVYELAENVTFDDPGSAIIIQADNVKLKLKNHSIHLTNDKATGILVTQSAEFVIENDAIVSKFTIPTNGAGIRIVESKKGLLKNIFTINHLTGLCIEKASDIRIEGSQFTKALLAGALVTEGTNIVFDTCVFSEDGFGLKFCGPNRDCSVLNSEFPSSIFSNLLVEQINGMMVDNCSFTNIEGAPIKPNLVQFGGALPCQACNDVIFKKCTLVNRPPHVPVLGNTAPEGLGIYQGSGFLVEDCVIDIDNTNQDPAADLSGIHISNPGLGPNGTVASDVIIRNCIIQGPATDGIYPDVGSSGVVIERCLAAGAQKDGIFLAGTTSSLVKDNLVVNNGTNGIFLGEQSYSNAIDHNVVTNNGFTPILTSILPVGNGVGISADSMGNLFEYNEVYSNAVDGFDDEGRGNRIFSNVAYSNHSHNYHAATDIIIELIPGFPALMGANITN